MSVEVSKDGLQATIRIPGWPLTVVDTPLGRQRKRDAIAQMEARFEEAYRCEKNGRTYRLRCQTVNEKHTTDGAVCEWLYNGEWRRMVNQEILREIKDMANRTWNGDDAEEGESVG